MKKTVFKFSLVIHPLNYIRDKETAEVWLSLFNFLENLSWFPVKNELLYS